MELKIGDVVKAKLSDVLMCVNCVQGDYVICNWFDNKTLMKGEFHKNNLTKVG